MDIYAVQDNFEKLHLSRTPKEMATDLLRKNFLDDPALSSMNSIEDMDEIWRRI